MKPKFILGVGAQKSGTTWLRSQLQQNEFADLGFKKEYHIWDVYYLGQPKNRKMEVTVNETPENATLRKMQTIPGHYEDYFRSLISGPVRITGDVTPSYSLLNAEQFSEIRKKLENAGFDIRVVFLMRDPVERIWSMLRMKQRNAVRTGNVISDEKLIKSFHRNSKSAEVDSRTRYDRIVETLKISFDPSHLYFDFFERLFDGNADKRLAGFLGENLNRFNPDMRINVSKAISLPDEIYEECRAYYSGVYDYCHREFPETKTLWAPRPRKGFFSRISRLF